MEHEKRYIEEDEITLKQVVMKVQEYFGEVIQNWKLIVFTTVLLTLAFVYKSISTPVTYSAELTFMVNEDDGRGMGGVSAILGQFGFGGGGKGKNNLKKILELARSRNIIQRVVFDTIKVKGKEDLLGNHIIHTYDFHEKWLEDTTGLNEFVFKNKNLLTRTERYALKSVYSKIVGAEKVEGIFSTKSDKDTGIMRFNTKTVDEELSIALCTVLYKHLSEFYVTRTIEKQQQTFDVMLQKVDSVKGVMAAKEYQLADFLDQNRGLYTAKAKRKEIELQRDVRLLNEMYAVTLKNFEIADFSLKNRTPFIQLIDEPIGPIKPKGASLIKNLIIGGFLGCFLSVFFILFRKIYTEAMRS